MSLPWIAFYPGDYLRKTQSLNTVQHGAYFLLLIECWTKGRIPEPTRTNDAILARITKLSVRRFRRQVSPILATYFNADGTNKRATEEVEKAEKHYMAKSLAGRKGGLKSGLARTVARGKQRSSASENGEANAKHSLKHSSTNQNKNITSSLPSAARAEIPAVENPPENNSNNIPNNISGTTQAAPKWQPRKEVEASKPVYEPGPVDQAQYWIIKAGKAP